MRRNAPARSAHSIRLALGCAMALGWSRSAAAQQPDPNAGGPPVVAPPAGTDAGPGYGPPAGPDPRRARRRAPEDEIVHAPAFAAHDGFPLVGFHNDRFYLRDATDTYRFYPQALLQLDTRVAAGRGVYDLSGPDSQSLRPRLEARRARVGVGGQVHEAWSFELSGDFARGPHLDYALVDMAAARWLHVTVGQQLVPFTMENRTPEPYYSWMERPLTVRFAQPSDKDLGVMIWGTAARDLVSYEGGVFGGDGQNRPNVDNRVDLAGRVVVHPLAGTESIARHIHIGLSGTYGTREAKNVGYDLSPLQTEGGFTFFDTTYRDGSRLHVLPSGTQSGMAGEVRVPVSRLDFRFEFVSVRRNTREALDGQQLSGVSERFGHLSGSSFYAQLGVWALGQPQILPEPGRYRPPHLSFPRGEPHRAYRGLEILARVEVLRATYSPGDRQSHPGDTRADQSINADVVGVGINYYATRHAALLLNYGYYLFPGSGTPDQNPSNSAVAPGNLSGHTGAHQMHELGARVQMFF